MFGFITRWYRTRKSKREIKQWSKRTDACGRTDFYVVRKYEYVGPYVDLHWIIMRHDGGHVLDTIYQRCHTRHVHDMFHMVGKHQLPHRLRQLNRQRDIDKKTQN